MRLPLKVLIALQIVLTCVSAKGQAPHAIDVDSLSNAIQNISGYTLEEMQQLVEKAKSPESRQNNLQAKNSALRSDNSFGYTLPPDTSSTSTYPVAMSDLRVNVSATGAATFDMPLDVPKGTGGMEPSLSISYNSQNGDDIAGFGCGVRGLSVITIGTKSVYYDNSASGIKHDTTDALFLDGKRLILKSGTEGMPGAVYQLEDDPVTVITVGGEYTTSTDGRYFTMNSADGITYQFGATNASRQYYTYSGKTKTMAWHVCRAEDANGNYITYSYKRNNYTIYPETIIYGKNANVQSSFLNEIKFTYASRPDITPYHIEGTLKGKLALRLSSIKAKTNGTLYRTYTLSYNSTSDQSALKRSRLIRVTESNGNGEQLKPTVIDWTYMPSTSLSSTVPMGLSMPSHEGVGSSVTIANRRFLAADVNGDGIADVIELMECSHPIPNTNIVEYPCYCSVFRSVVSQNGTVTYSQPLVYLLDYIPSPQWMFMTGARTGDFIADYDGDGINDIIAPFWMEHLESADSYYSRIIYGKDIRDGILTNVSATLSHNVTENLSGVLQDAADFRGYGRAQVVMMEQNVSGGSVQCYMYEYGQQHVTLFNLNLSVTPKELIAVDMNNDGMNDLLVLHANGYKVFFNKGGATPFSGSPDKSGSTVKHTSRFQLGDFNGDGIVDIITNDNGMSYWKLSLGNGAGSFATAKNIPLPLYDQQTEDDDSFMNSLAYDINNDNKTDLFIGKTVFGGTGGDKTHCAWFTCTGDTLTQLWTSSSVKISDGQTGLFALGDFSGNGRMELMNYGYNCNGTTNVNQDAAFHVYRNNGLTAASGRVRKLTDGMGNTTSFTYKSLAGSGIYDRDAVYEETHIDTSYPVVDCTPPLVAVHTVKTSNGSLAEETRTYRYGGLKVHLQGKGLLGMSAIHYTENVSGADVRIGIPQWDVAFAQPSVTYKKKTVGGLTSSEKYSFSYYGRGGRLFTMSWKDCESVDTEGLLTTTTDKYSSAYGYQTEHIVSYYGDIIDHTVYSGYSQKGGKYVPGLVDRWREVNEMLFDIDHTFPIVHRKAQYTYDDSGNIIRMIENFGSSKPLTTSYSYDTFGNEVTSTTSGQGVARFIRKASYDETGRFVTRRWTNPETESVTYTYDTFGNMVAETDDTETDTPLTTSYSYDGWGNRIMVVTPIGTRVKTMKGWGDSSVPRKHHFTLEQGDAKAWVKTWYDSYGRETVVESVGPTDIMVLKNTSYNPNGTVNKLSQREGNFVKYNYYTYDGAGRLLKDSCEQTGSVVTHTYSTDGQRKIITTNDNGMVTTRQYDLSGELITSSDVNQELWYAYNSLGKIELIHRDSGEDTIMVMSYDDCANMVSAKDKDSGTTTYTYDALGRVLTSTDANGHTKTHTYDALGRLVQKTAGDMTFSYSYGATGRSRMRLAMEESDNYQHTYQYDLYGRINVEAEYFGDEISKIRYYSYDSNGLMNGNAWLTTLNGSTGGFGTSVEYDCYGNETALDVAGTRQRTLTVYSGKVMTQTYPDGYLQTSRSTYGTQLDRRLCLGSAIVKSMTFQFDPATGNMTGRSHMYTNSSQETFAYDNLNRLTSVTNGSESESFAYSANGNILSKTGVGTYTYSSQHPHAVARVSAMENGSADSQTIVYNALGKVESVSEGGFTQTFTYGPDSERKTSLLTNNGTIQKKFFYGAGYDIVRIGSSYFTMYRFDDLVLYQYSLFSPQVMHTIKDNLGSYVRIYNPSNALVYDASYDAWGKKTEHTNTIYFNRGFCGHEHMDEFGLINMNGRLYDPTLARFLSPDPLITDIGNLQDFNKYSYCRNNPLYYVDPTGKSVWKTIMNFGKNLSKMLLFKKSPLSVIKHFARDIITDGYQMGRIAYGLLFVGSLKQMSSRFTLDILQTSIGVLYSTGRVLVEPIDAVEYFNGATYIINQRHKRNDPFKLSYGITIGNYINISSQYIPRDENGNFNVHYDKYGLYKHEYGHYLQSQAHHFAYLFDIGIPSILSADTDKANHKYSSVEKAANKRAYSFFGGTESIYHWNYDSYPLR